MSNSHQISSVIRTLYSYEAQSAEEEHSFTAGQRLFVVGDDTGDPDWISATFDPIHLDTKQVPRTYVEEEVRH